MKYWLLKTEPENWSWIDQLNSKNQSAEWNGVRNYQASKNLKNMKKKDLCFFYHTGKEKKIVGIVKVIKEHFKDKSDKTNRFVSIIVRAQNELIKPVTLEEIKKIRHFKKLALVKQSRLSVMEIDNNHELRNNSNTIEVETISLNNLIEENASESNIDYISIDTEGSEYEILKDFNFKKYNVEIFTVEHNFVEKKRDLIFALMTSHNYVRVFTNISQWDDWYIKKNNKILLSMMDN